ncbi:unnamed protein product [Symbiodinium sp. CCMP2456]|nr:unnamed protein product [Symbiodinium sp. CCMP2456]
MEVRVPPTHWARVAGGPRLHEIAGHLVWDVPRTAQRGGPSGRFPFRGGALFGAAVAFRQRLGRSLSRTLPSSGGAAALPEGGEEVAASVSRTSAPVVAAARKAKRVAEYQRMQRQSLIDASAAGLLGALLAYLNNGVDASEGWLVGVAFGVLYLLILQQDVAKLSTEWNPFSVTNPLRILRFLLPFGLVLALGLQYASSIGFDVWLERLAWEPGVNFTGVVASRSSLFAALVGYVVSSAVLPLRGLFETLPEARTLVKAVPGSLGVALQLADQVPSKAPAAAKVPVEVVPVLLITGPRGCGKSTLAEQLRHQDSRFQEPEWVSTGRCASTGTAEQRLLSKEEFESLSKTGSLAVSYTPSGEDLQEVDVGLPAMSVLASVQARNDLDCPLRRHIRQIVPAASIAMAYPCTCSCSCGWYPPVQVEGAPADAWWKEAIRHETENRWYVRQLPGAWAATFGGSQVGELIRHQVEPASDRSFRPFGRRVLAEPRESEEFKKVMTWVDQESEPRARPAPSQPCQACQPCAPTTPTPAAHVPPPAVPLSAPAPTPAATAPAGLPSSFSACGAEPATPTAPGAPVPAQVVRPPIPEVPPGMRLEPVTFVQTAEPVSREVASAEVQPSPSLAPGAGVTDEKDSTLVPGDFQLHPAAASVGQATKEALGAKLGVVQAAAKLKVSSGRKETREKSKGRMQGRQKEAEDQWISRQKPKPESRHSYNANSSLQAMEHSQEAWH